MELNTILRKSMFKALAEGKFEGREYHPFCYKAEEKRVGLTHMGDFESNKIATTTEVIRSGIEN